MANSSRLKLPDFIYSHEQIGLYILQLEHYKTLLLKEKTKSASRLGYGAERRDFISPELKKYLFSISQNKDITYELIEQVFDFLKEVHSTAPRLHLTFAAIAGDSIKEEITKWARKNIGELVLVSFHYDKSVVGGVVVRTRNKVFDFSYSRKLLNPKVKISNIINAKSYS